MTLDVWSAEGKPGNYITILEPFFFHSHNSTQLMWSRLSVNKHISLERASDLSKVTQRIHWRLG